MGLCVGTVGGIAPIMLNTIFVGSNNAPVIDSQIAEQNYTTGFTASLLSFSGSFSDPDGDSLTYSISSHDESVATVEITDPVLLRFTVTEVSDGYTMLTLTASDGQASTNMYIHVTIDPAGPLHSIPFLKDSYDDYILDSYGRRIVMPY